MPDMIIDNPAPVRFSVDQQRRTIVGLAVPYGEVGANWSGQWRFGKGALRWDKVKVLDGHNWDRAVGTATLEDTDEGPVMTAHIARGARGDEMLALAEDGVYDGLSIGLADGLDYETDDQGVRDVKSARIREVSLTPFPAFENAQIRSVAASAAPNRKEQAAMPDTTSKTETQVQQPPAPEQQHSQQPAQQPQPAAPADADGRQDFGGQPVPPRETVPAGGAQFTVHEPPCYRFDGLKGQHEFSSDVFAVIRRGDRDAQARIDGFIAEQFADVKTTNVTGVNPNKYRPDLYVGSDPVVTPIFDALHKGALVDGTPFVAPKFDSASGLISDHTEGTEPTGGSWKATSQTVTPSAVSGEVDITREVIDAGGSPQVSGLIWAEIQKAYAKSMETKSAALLTGATVTELGTAPTAGDVDDTLVREVTANLGTLPFLSYGSDFSTNVYTHADLYAALIAAKDTSGRPLLPLNGPVNSDGSSADRLQSVSLAGYRFLPASSLGASGSKMKSFIFDPSFGGVWASNAQRITLNPTVAYGAKIGVFGYLATAILNSKRVRKITYNPTAA